MRGAREHGYHAGDKVIVLNFEEVWGQYLSMFINVSYVLRKSGVDVYLIIGLR
jgi:hypothetical protein